MGGLNQCAVFALLLVVSACKSSPRDKLDLAENEKLYQDSGYRAVGAIAEFDGWVMPVLDQREGIATPAEASGPYPVQWMPDTYWPRPLSVMVEDIVRREIADSGLFSATTTEADPNAVALRVAIREARSGWEERPFGRRALASVTLQVAVLSPVRDDGRRSVLFENSVEGAFESPVAPRPPTQPQALGAALRVAMLRLCKGLDDAGVGRRAAAQPMLVDDSDR